MKIEFLRQVKHAGRTHEKGDSVSVTETLGEYFCHCGWAKRHDGESIAAQPQPLHVTLDVHNGNHTHDAQKVGG